MKKLVIGFDKILHFICCIIITTIAFAGFCFTGLSNALCVIGGFVIAMLIGFAKEFHDKKRGEIFDWKNIIADFVGAGIWSVIWLDIPLLTAIVVSVFSLFLIFCVEFDWS